MMLAVSDTLYRFPSSNSAIFINPEHKAEIKEFQAKN